MNGSTTSAVLTDSIDSLSSSRLLGSVYSDASSKRGASQISRSYKQASKFFLQRRFPEALLTIQPLITAPKDNGLSSPGRAAPVAAASRTNRVKVWNLYLTLLNSIIELGADDGKNLFGNAQWRAMVAKVRDGSIWEEVVQIGYNGIEGSVDADVVSNLATLLISHSPTQTLNQQRLETYLSASSYPSLDLADRFADTASNDSDLTARPARSTGTDTPRDLNSRVKVLELYTLHVLPRNEEWAYAREFISMSEVLDDDTREDFLATLASLEEQRVTDAEREAGLLREQADELERARVEAEAERRRKEEEEDARREETERRIWENEHRRPGSEKDYGIEDALPTPKAARKVPGPSSLKGGGPKGNGPRLSPVSRRTPAKKTPPGVYGRGVALVGNLQRLVLQMAREMSKSPGALLRTLVFCMALLLALGRSDVRDRVAKITGAAWDRMKKTVGMGVKVSYI